MQTLVCQAGHEWSRTPSRGRPPKACPEHQSPASQQAAERHRTFYVPHPLPIAPKPVPISDAERREIARRASLARWATVPAQERSEAARRAARALHAKLGHVPPPPVAEVPCPWCGAVMRGAKRKQCGAPECRRQWHAERMRRHMHERQARLLGNGSHLGCNIKRGNRVSVSAVA